VQVTHTLQPGISSADSLFSLASLLISWLLG